MEGDSGVGGQIIGTDGPSQTVSSDGDPQQGAQAQGDAAPVRELSQSQHDAHAEMARIYAGMAERDSPKQRSQDWRRVNDLHKYIYNGADKPAWFQAGQDVAASDMRPANSERDVFEQQNEPFNHQVSDRLAQYMRSQQAGPWGEAAVAMAENLKMDESTGESFCRRVAVYVRGGALDGGNFVQLTPQEHEELGAELIRGFGSREKAEEMVAGAIAHLKRSPELYQKLVKHGAFNSAISYDPKMLLVLHAAELRARARGR